MKKIIFFFILFICCLPGYTQTIPEEKLSRLRQLGKTTNSLALIVIQNNKVVVEDYYGKEQSPVYISSVSKVLVSMAIVKLLSEGKISSLNQPISDFFPEWKQGRKKFITIRMLLDHTSGLQNERAAFLELEPPPNFKVKNVVQLALAAELNSFPGKVFDYNNKAVALLGGIIEKASGKRMEKYFEEEFYKSMEIEKYGWIQDEVGNPTAHGAFVLGARDLAKFGELMVNKGVYNGKRFFKENWIDSSTASSHVLDERLGLLWWRYAKETKRVIDSGQVTKIKALHMDSLNYSKLSPLFFKTFSNGEYFAELDNIFGKNWMRLSDSLLKGQGMYFYNFPKLKTVSKILGYYHTGFGGNYIVIVPDMKLVAVRVVKRDEKYNQETDAFRHFVDEVFKLID